MPAYKFPTPLGGSRKLERLRALVQLAALYDHQLGELTEADFNKLVKLTKSNSCLANLLMKIQSKSFPHKGTPFSWGDAVAWVADNIYAVSRTVLRLPIDKPVESAEN